MSAKEDTASLMLAVEIRYPWRMIGEVIGNYRVTARLGVGETGTVYRAEHTVIGRHVAIKFLAPELSSNDRLMSAFFDELRTVTSIQHPSVIELFDFGYHNGAPYMVMEYLEYQTLAAHIQHGGPMRVSLVLDIARQVTGALEAAHRAGVVHKDLKPDNIVLVPDSAVPGGERVKLLDFGMAVLLTDSDPGARLHRQGAELPRYMAPEQLDGSLGGPDHRVDLYALGCILFEMLAGQPRFAVESSTELASFHLHGEPPWLKPLVPDVPSTLEAVVRTLLARKPQDRFASATELLEAFAIMESSAAGGAHFTEFPEEPVSISFIQPEPVKSVPLSAGNEPQRGRMRLVVLSILLLACVALAIGLLVLQ